MPNVVFVAPYPAEATVRFTQAAAQLEGVRLGLVSHQPLEATAEPLRSSLAGHWQVDSAFDAGQLATAVRGIAGQMGGVDRLIGILEQLQVPLAEVRDALGIEGMNTETAHNFRDKARMKTLMRQKGLPCARHHLAASTEDALAFARASGFPLVVKPPAGAGAKATFRVDDEKRLAEVLGYSRPSAAQPVLLEQYLTGLERSFETVVVRGRPVWYSLSHYLPTPLEAQENPWIQWCVLLPRHVDGPEYRQIREAGPQAVAALGLRTGLTHMEWFQLPDGSIAISEVAARPPGAQITAMTSLAHDFDLYRAWARLMIFEEFDPPERKFAAGAAFIRAMGEGGKVGRVRGLAEAQKKLGDVVIDAKLPRPGQARQAGYEGDGWVLLRHPDTEVVERGLHELVTTLRVESAP